MNRLFMCVAFAFALAVLGVPALAAQDEDDALVYYEMFKFTKDFGEKAAFLSVMGESNDEIIIGSFNEALESLLNVDRTSLTVSEAQDYDRAIRVAAANLGRFEYTPSAGNLIKLFRSKSADALVRAEAAISLGLMRATEFVPEIATFLETLSLSPTEDPDAGEKLAYGCIVSLANMRDSRGWPATFFATQAWYSQRIRTEAEEALAKIQPRPTVELLQIIKGSYDIRYKIFALKYAASAPGTPEFKMEIAREAYRQGLAVMSGGTMTKQKYQEFRTTALTYLISYNDKSGEMIPSFESSWPSAQLDERIQIAYFLGMNASDPAVSLLMQYINEADSSKRAGISGSDQDRLAKVLFQAAGKTKNSRLVPVLESVIRNNQWTSSVTMSAREALTAIKGP